MKLRDRLLVCLYVALAALPTIALALKLTDRKLEGVVARPKRPALTADAFRTDKFQPAFTEWFESALGYRNWAVFVDNTILYHAFGETKSGARVVLGEGDVLFERDDIGLLNKPVPPELAVDNMADRISTLQRRLSARGRAFVPIIVPSKTSIWRDAVSDKWQLPHGDEYPSDQIYLRTKRALDARGILYVDARELLTTKQDVPRHLLWGPQARHWSEYGACLALQRVLATAERLSGRKVDMPCRYDVRRVRRSHFNYDLMRLLNVWNPRLSRENAVVTFDAPPPDPKPRILIIASSFGWELFRVAEESHRFREIWLDYYDYQLFGPAGVEYADPPVSSEIWQDVFLDEDVYVFELFETYLYVNDQFQRALDKLIDQVPPP
jgi:hypothetical protein